ncbi:MAG TPA: hypothetical protein VFX70_03775 [Mycobacteriales bacterium]|nr:hypothetical protein [Mycobacteriales bacterium]
MGIFGKARAKDTGSVGTFTSPHSVADTLRAASVAVAPELSSRKVEVSGPLMAASIYLSRLDETGLTVTAGNRIETYFQFVVDLEPSGDGCTGRVSFDRPRSQISRWRGNSMDLAANLSLRLHEYSVRTGEWKC